MAGGSWLQRLKQGRGRSAGKLGQGIAGIVGGRKLDAAMLQEIEEALIAADLGPQVAARLTAALAKSASRGETDEESVRRLLASEIAAILEPVARPLRPDPAHRPHVVLVVGVNGTGKTTTIGKLAHFFAGEGRRVVLAAGDTFRAAAIEQLKIWGERSGAEVVARAQGSDAAGLAFEALERAKAIDADLLFVDTAGRLHNKADLMAELGKVTRVLAKLDPTAPHDVILVLDATTGQNAIRQVETFRETVKLTGLVVTKLDGTAKGGVLVALAEKFALPVVAIGVGEAAEDLRPFEASSFAHSLLGIDNERPVA
ncbi:MAG: signal recognition particle-docking protein FtsY [Rhodospirillaceae bacterium]|nr:signal recognition particle-docking protein FtsY [Rhodospirillaceae bacterium]